MNAVLAELAPSHKARRAADRQAWKRKIASWAAEHPLTPSVSETEIKPQHLVREIDRLSGGDAIVCSDVGQHQMWGRSSFGSTGPGCGSAPGTRLDGVRAPFRDRRADRQPGPARLRPGGDGGFQMSIPELATVANNSLPIKIV